MAKVFLILLGVIFSFIVKAQDVELLGEIRDSIVWNANKMVSSSGDNQKLFYSDRIELLVDSFIKQENSIDFNMDSLQYVNVLSSDDQNIRIFTWLVPLSGKVYGYRGYVQTYSKRKKTYQSFRLVDKSARMSGVMSKTLNPKKWYGAYYYKLISTKRGSKTFYTLIGWKGIDKTIQSKVIEVIYLRSDGLVSFGYNLFKIKGFEYFGRINSPKRLVFKYSSMASMHLDYDYQTIVIKKKEKSSRKKRKRRKKKRNVGFKAQSKTEKLETKKTYIKDDMIVMDRIIPTSQELKGFYDFYYPEKNIVDALRYDGRVWVYYPDIDARNKPAEIKSEEKIIEYDLYPPNE